MFTPSEDELQLRGTCSVLLLQHELEFPIAFILLEGSWSVYITTSHASQSHYIHPNVDPARILVRTLSSFHPGV